MPINHIKNSSSKLFFLVAYNGLRVGALSPLFRTKIGVNAGAGLWRLHAVMD